MHVHTDREVMEHLTEIGVRLGAFTTRLPRGFFPRVVLHQLELIGELFSHILEEIDGLPSMRARVLLQRPVAFCAHRLCFLHEITHGDVPISWIALASIPDYELHIEERLWLIAEKLGILYTCFMMGHRRFCVCQGNSMSWLGRVARLSHLLRGIYRECMHYRESEERALRIFQYRLCVKGLDNIRVLQMNENLPYDEIEPLASWVYIDSIWRVDVRLGERLMDLGPRQGDSMIFMKETLRKICQLQVEYEENRAVYPLLIQAVEELPIVISRLSSRCRNALLQGLCEVEAMESAYIQVLLEEDDEIPPEQGAMLNLSSVWSVICRIEEDLSPPEAREEAWVDLFLESDKEDENDD